MSAARRSSSSLTRTGDGLFVLLALDEARDLRHRIQVVRHQFRVLDLNPVLLLEVADELEDACRIDNAAFLERIVVGEGEPSGLVSKQEVIDDERAQPLMNVGFHE